jgi:phosphoglucosamine mutase
MLEAAVAAGVAAGRRRRAARRRAADARARRCCPPLRLRPRRVISASHNPYRDNGIKFFGPTASSSPTRHRGRDRARARASRRRRPRIGRVRALHGALEDYLRELHERFAGPRPERPRVLLDCANGATYRAAPGDLPPPRRRRRRDRRRARRAQHQRRLRLDARRGARRGACAPAATTSASPSTATATACWPSTARRGRRRRRADRARRAAPARARPLPGDGVAVTVMTNYGFHTAMRGAGIEVATTPVGDRYVLEELRERGWALGGEQSGHIIDMGFVPSGDGIAAALLTLEALGGGDLAERTRWRSCRSARQRPRRRPRRARRRARVTRRSSASRARSRAAAACSCARAAPSRSCA